MSAKAYSKSPAFEPLCDVPAIELTCRKPPFEPEETIVLNGVFSRLILSKAVSEQSGAHGAVVLWLRGAEWVYWVHCSLR